MSPDEQDPRQIEKNEEEEEDVVLAAEDVEEVLEDDGLKPDDMDEDMPADHEPVIKDEGEEEGKPSNAWGGTCEFTQLLLSLFLS